VTAGGPGRAGRRELERAVQPAQREAAGAVVRAPVAQAPAARAAVEVGAVRPEAAASRARGNVRSLSAPCWIHKR